MQRSRPAARLSVVALAGAVGLSVFSSSCKEKKEKPFDQDVVAVVNGEVVSRAEFETELGRDLQALEAVEPRSPEQVDPYRRALLDTLIERTLLLGEARKLNLVVTAEEVDRRVLRLSADFPDEGFDEALAQGQLSMADLKRKTAALITVERLFDEHVYPRVAVTEGELRAFYDAHPEQFAQAEQVRAAQIVVNSLEEARRLQGLLRQGRKFPDLARRYSLSADARVGGDLGFFSRGVMPPPFEEVAFKLAVGQVSDVVTTEYGFHLFKVLERRAAQKREFSEVRGQVEQKLVALKRAEAQKTWVAKLKQEASIQVNEPLLQSIGHRATPPRGGGK
jgi:peptidyl-prolyl cis-trans isomerase C